MVPDSNGTSSLLVQGNKLLCLDYQEGHAFRKL